MPNTTRREFLRSGLFAGTVPLFGSLLAEAFSADDSLDVDNAIKSAAGEAELSMLFHGRTPADAAEWQQAFRAKLHELLGNSDPPAEWQVEEERKTEFADHTRYELLLEAENVPTLPVYLLIPQGATETNKAPAVLCVHGHGDYGHHPIVGRTDLPGVEQAIARANYDYGLQFVRRGYVVAAPCMIPFGRRVDRDRYGNQDPCGVNFVRMQAYGQLPITANLRDLRWSLDLLESRPEVLPGRLGCAGLSYGGRMTMLAAAMDQRIQIADVSGALNLLQERITHRYSCGSQVIPGLLKYGDFSEIGSLIAPRPCVWEVGSRDGLIVPQWDEIFKKRLRRIYKAYNAEKQLQFDHFEGGHRFSGEVAFPLFDKVLQG